MNKKIITTVKDIELKKGTVVPNLYPSNAGIKFRVIIPKGSELVYEGYGSSSCFYVTAKEKGGVFITTPIDGIVFSMLFDIAVKDGGKQIILHNGIKEYKMFSLITENRIKPEEANYITSFYQTSLRKAMVEARLFVERNYEGEFNYTVRQ